uniref:Growth arrest-specific protein 7 n=1 Tax=Canis lupus familiaris TaxID=9615 RepID=A0A8C0LXP8_CANLF
MVPPPPGEESQIVILPPGWQSYLSPQGRRYYVNTTTNETTWERPSSSPGIPASPGPHRSSLPPTVNGYHVAGTPAHPPETAHMSVRKSTGDSQINCVTFPHPDTMPEQQLLKPTEWSYCDYFWADKKDPQGNGTVAGFELLLQKQLKGKQMQKEMSEFIRERIKIEEEYAKNLAKLSQNSLAAQEEGSLGEAWAQVKKSLADEAEVHLKFSAKLHSEVEKPLMNFRENFKKDMKKCDHHIADLRKQLASRYAAVEKARKALTERQRDLEMKTQQLEIKLSNKTEEDIKKARRKSTQAGAGAAGGGEGGDDPAAPVPVHPAAARDGHVQPKHSRACGPTASKSGPSQRQGAVGQRAQDRQHPPCGHGDLGWHTQPRGSCCREGPGVPRRGGGSAHCGARCRAQPPSHPLSWSRATELVIPEGRPCQELPAFPGQEDGSTALPRLRGRRPHPDSCVLLPAPRTD